MKSILILAAILAGFVQPPAAPPPGAQRGGPPPAGRGGGRGRGPIQVMTLSSTAFADGGQMPVKYTQAGEQASPPLSWTNVPDGTVSFVLIVHDADAAIG